MWGLGLFSDQQGSKDPKAELGAGWALSRGPQGRAHLTALSREDALSPETVLLLPQSRG